MPTHILTRLGNFLRVLVNSVPLMLMVSPLLADDAATDELPSVAFYYAAKPPVELLNQFDWAVIDADSVTAEERRDIEAQGAKAFAYVSVGEWEPERASTRSKPENALVAENPDWNSRVADLSHADWRGFLHRRIDELWQQGYRAFFFDTLDSYYRFAESEKDINAQQAGLVRFIKEVHRRHPGIDLMLNRGFEVLDQVHDKIVGVAAESLYQRWTPGTKIYGPVAGNDTQWLTRQLERVKAYGLPAIAIDYVQPHDRELARRTARRIHDAGFVPWVTTPGLDQMGVGLIEPIPRRVLLIYDKEATEDQDVANHDAFRYLAVVLEYLGLAVEYQDVQGPYPPGLANGRYAGIVTWFQGPTDYADQLTSWLVEQVDAGSKLLVMGHSAINFAGPLGDLAGLASAAALEPGKIRIDDHDDMLGFEGPLPGPGPSAEGFRSLREDNVEHLTLTDSQGGKLSPVITGPWGGVALYPWLIQSAGDGQQRWILDPFAFVTESLDLPPFPVPDATTENGARFWLNHIDGDAFISRGEWPGAPFTGQVMLNEILKRYQVPTTVSVVEGEFGEGGLREDLREQLEPIAREIFALPWVEIATHTYSHPFAWLKLEEGDPAGQGATSAGFPFNMELDDYAYSLEREVAGSTRYINHELAPPGKQVKTILWSGDAIAPEGALAIADRLGLSNLNGGNTHITRDNPSLTQVSAMLRPAGPYLQVLAPQINENVYTDHMLAPKWGYRRVLETYALTDRPRRLKPISIYYHFYSAAYPASLNALKEVYEGVMSQETLPVHVSTWSNIAKQWYELGIARHLDGGWQITGATEARTLRLSEALGWPDMSASSDVASLREIPSGRYISLRGASKQMLYMQPNRPQLPYLSYSNGRLRSWERKASGGFVATLAAEQVDLKVDIANVASCRVEASSGSRVIAGDGMKLRFSGPGPFDLEVRCEP